MKLLLLVVVAVIAATKTPPSLPGAFSANITTAKNHRGVLYFDNTKQSLRLDLAWHSGLFGYLASEMVQRYDVTPSVQYILSNATNECQRTTAEPQTLLPMYVPPSASFVAYEEMNGAMCEHWNDNFLDIVKADYWVANSTVNKKTNWRIVRRKVHVAILGTIMDWSFSNVVVGLQDAALFNPPKGCPPIVPPVYYSVSGYVKSATTNVPIPFANVTIFSENRTVVKETTADKNGIYTFSKEDEGMVWIKAHNNSGYIEQEIKFNLTHDVAAGTSADILVSPILPPNQLRVVLTWGYMPQDLDTHVWDGSCELYYGNMQCQDMTLDHDTRTGYGPETATITLAPNPDVAAFGYFVNQYSSQGTLATSSAKINVFVGNEHTMSLSIPTSGTGSYWNIGTINAETGDFMVRDNAIEESKPSSPSSFPLPICQTVADRTDIYKSFSLNAPKIGLIGVGTKLSVLGYFGDEAAFIKIDASGTTGYILVSDCTIS